MREDALKDLWERARHRGLYPQQWLKRWRLGLNFDLEFLRVSEMRLALPRGKVPNCRDCQELCCTGPKAIIHLRLKDIANMLDQGLSKAMVVSAKAPDSIGKNEAEKEFDDSIFGRVFPTLARDRFGTCTLLRDDLKCSIYPKWPLSCARYPFAVDAKNKIIYYAKGCTSFELLPPDAASDRFGYLVTAAVESYNERIKDLLLLAYAYKELEHLELTRYLNTPLLHKEWRWLIA